MSNRSEADRKLVVLDELTDQQPSRVNGPAFAWPIPDFIQWDRESFFTPVPNPSRRVLSPGWVVDLARVATIQRPLPFVLFPDTVLGSLIWGASSETRRWPANWRKVVTRGLLGAGPALEPIGSGFLADQQSEEWGFYEVETPAWTNGEASCSPRCPLHRGSGVGKHRHFRLQFRLRGQGSMKLFNPELTWDLLRSLDDDSADVKYYDFRVSKWTSAEVKEREKAIRKILDRRHAMMARRECTEADAWWDEVLGEHVSRDELEWELKHLRAGQPKVSGLFACYLPARVFGPSPKVGLTQRQCHLLSALVGETTRASEKSDRPDKALLVRVDSEAERPRLSIPLPPGLAAGEYVAFNGSGWGKRIRLQGYGFKIETWAAKAGFPDTAPAELLADFQVIAGPFGLKVACWSKDDGTWRGLDDLQALARTKVGRDWLKGCMLRVYTAADFLVRWRQYFAGKLGFRSLPGGEGETPAPAKDGGIHSAVELAQWMKEKKYTDRSLGDLLGVGRSKVNLVKNGKRRWSADFERRLNGILDIL